MKPSTALANGRRVIPGYCEPDLAIWQGDVWYASTLGVMAVGYGIFPVQLTAKPETMGGRCWWWPKEWDRLDVILPCGCPDRSVKIALDVALAHLCQAHHPGSRTLDREQPVWDDRAVFDWLRSMGL